MGPIWWWAGWWRRWCEQSLPNNVFVLEYDLGRWSGEWWNALSHLATAHLVKAQTTDMLSDGLYGHAEMG